MKLSNQQWGGNCLQTQINKLSALEGKAGAELRDSFIFLIPESTSNLHVRRSAPSSLARVGRMGEGLADAIALKEFVFRTCLYQLLVRKGSFNLPVSLCLFLCSHLLTGAGDNFLLLDSDTAPWVLFLRVCVATVFPACLCLSSGHTMRVAGSPRLMLI